MGLDATKNVLEFPTKGDSNQSTQLQRLALLVAKCQKTNKKGADQSARMCRLVCAFAVRKRRRQDHAVYTETIYGGMDTIFHFSPGHKKIH